MGHLIQHGASTYLLMASNSQCRYTLLILAGVIYSSTIGLHSAPCLHFSILTSSDKDHFPSAHLIILQHREGFLTS